METWEKCIHNQVLVMFRCVLVAAAIACAAVRNPVHRHLSHLCSISAGQGDCLAPWCFQAGSRSCVGSASCSVLTSSPAPHCWSEQERLLPHQPHVCPYLFCPPCLIQMPGPGSHISSLHSIQEQGLAYQLGISFSCVARECWQWPRE